jgi:WWE domain
MSNFFGSEPDTSVSQSREETLPFNQTIPALNNDTTADISDKLDSLSMSENIGSQLSLFATSELDASLALKTPVAFDSMIPKYLDTQADSAARTTPSPAPSLSKSFRPVYRHWFFQNLYWHPFSMSDSLALDEAIASGKETVVTDGGRFEVNLKEGRRTSIYWLSGSNVIRRCSWFFKNPNNAEANLIPFDEATADYLESEYEKAFSLNSWNHQLWLPNTEELIVFKDAATLEYHQMGQVLVVKRGVDEFVIDDGEEAPVDHLIISVSGFGDKVGDSGKISTFFEKFPALIACYPQQLTSSGLNAWKRSNITTATPLIAGRLDAAKFFPSP